MKQVFSTDDFQEIRSLILDARETAIKNEYAKRVQDSKKNSQYYNDMLLRLGNTERQITGIK